MAVTQYRWEKARRSEAVFDTDGALQDEYVGQIWIESRSWELPLHEIGYYVVEKHIGKGFATEATKAGPVRDTSAMRLKEQMEFWSVSYVMVY